MGKSAQSPTASCTGAKPSPPDVPQFVHSDEISQMRYLSFIPSYKKESFSNRSFVYAAHHIPHMRVRFWVPALFAGHVTFGRATQMVLSGVDFRSMRGENSDKSPVDRRTANRRRDFDSEHRDVVARHPWICGACARPVIDLDTLPIAPSPPRPGDEAGREHNAARPSIGRLL